MNTATLGTGSSIEFLTSHWQGLVISYNFEPIRRKAVRTSHMLTPIAQPGQFGGHTYMPSQHADPGVLSLQTVFIPDAPPPLHAPPEAMLLTVPGHQSSTRVHHLLRLFGFVRAIRYQVPYEDRATALVEIKLSGALAINTIFAPLRLLTSEPWEMVIPPPRTVFSAEAWELHILPHTVPETVEPWEEATIPNAPATLRSAETWES